MATPNTDGIDTSHYQSLTTTDLPRLTFAMHKATEGASYKDPTLGKFISRYRSSAVKHVGFYHFLRAGDPDGQAANFISTVKNVGFDPGDFWVVDWERAGDGKSASPVEVDRFRRKVGAVFGESCGAVYSAPWVSGFAQWRKANPKVAFFLANYRTSKLLPFNGWSKSARWDATAWQWTSKGRVTGIAGRVDLNHVFKPAWFSKLTPTPLTAPHAVIRLTDPPTTSVYVEALSRCLVAYGWYSGVQDTYGPNLENAWRQTQKRFGLPVNGIYDELGRVKLQQYINTHPVA